MRDAIAEILAAEGTLHRREIYDGLVKRCVQIGGQNPISNVSVHLSMDSRFENVGREVWQLAAHNDETTVNTNDIGSESGLEEAEDDDVPW